jgi:hypothetical protein
MKFYNVAKVAHGWFVKFLMELFVTVTGAEIANDSGDDVPEPVVKLDLLVEEVPTVKKDVMQPRHLRSRSRNQPMNRKSPNPETAVWCE